MRWFHPYTYAQHSHKFNPQFNGNPTNIAVGGPISANP